MNTLDLHDSFAPLPADLAADAAANDGPVPGTRTRWTDMNLLVATTVARVSAHLTSSGGHVTLQLAAGHPVALGDSAALQFALAGLLTAMLADHEAHVRVEVGEDEHDVCVAIVSDSLLPLAVVQALSPDTLGDGDPTVSHCRRLVEACGGRLTLTEDQGELALQMNVPRCPLGPGVRVFPPIAARPHRAGANANARMSA